MEEGKDKLLVNIKAKGEEERGWGIICGSWVRVEKSNNMFRWSG